MARVEHLTAKGRDGSVDGLHENALTIELGGDVSDASSLDLLPSYFFAVVGIEQDPAELDDLGRVFRNIYPMLVTGGSYMDDDVSVQSIRFLGGLVLLQLLVLGRGHFCEGRAARDDEEKARRKMEEVVRRGVD